MTSDRALEIIGAYGAKPVGWPAAERAAVLAAAAHDAAVGAALAEAGELDALLRAWAADVPVRQFDVATLLPARTIAAPQHSRVLRWASGGALAATIAAVLVIAAPNLVSGVSPLPTRIVAPLETASTDTEPLEGFALIFTPTADEEDLI